MKWRVIVCRSAFKSPSGLPGIFGDSWPRFTRLELATNGIQRKASSELPAACCEIPSGDVRTSSAIESGPSVTVYTEFRGANFRMKGDVQEVAWERRQEFVDYFLFH